MRTFKYKKVFCLLALVILLSGCGTKYLYDESWYDNSDGNWSNADSVLNGKPLVEDKSVYSSDQDGEISHLYLTVQSGYNKKLDKLYTFDYLKNYTDSDLEKDEEPFCNIIMSEGTESSSSKLSNFGFAETESNGKLTIKGNTSKIKTRSYQIKLYERAGLWRGVSTINLVKDLNDLSRMKQKLCFDAVENLKDTAGMRTRFVRLFVMDTTSDKELAYEDLGVFTYIEQPNKKYLKARGLDTSGNMYRAEGFDFSRHADVLLNEDDLKYDEDAFETVLNIREGNSHKKLLTMLDKLNDESIPIDTIIKSHFNEDNLLTFAAVNILFSNIEGYRDEYLIYSPNNSDTWYLFTSDFDKAFANSNINGDPSIPDYIVGGGFLHNNVLFRRYLSVPENVKKLQQKMEEIRKIISDSFIEKQTELYKNTILRYVYSVPEIRLLPRAAEYVEPYIDSLSKLVKTNYTAFTNTTNAPIAPYITSFNVQGDSATIYYQRTGDLSYKLELSTTSDFKNIFYTSEETKEDHFIVHNLPQGSCFARVVCKYLYNKVIYSTNIADDFYGDKHYGCILIEKEWA